MSVIESKAEVGRTCGDFRKRQGDEDEGGTVLIYIKFPEDRDGSLLG
jgi:hypothetical protein